MCCMEFDYQSFLINMKLNYYLLYLSQVINVSLKLEEI